MYSLIRLAVDVQVLTTTQVDLAPRQSSFLNQAGVSRKPCFAFELHSYTWSHHVTLLLHLVGDRPRWPQFTTTDHLDVS